MHRSLNIPRFSQQKSQEYDQLNNGVLSSDDFHMYIYKVRRCPRIRFHDWTECPYAHQGEKAKRRDPRRFHYHPVFCPEFQEGKGTCPKGDYCENAHGIFEYWLHPTMYRTRHCHAKEECIRKVGFFAHSDEELRIHMKRCYNHLAKMVVSPPTEIVQLAQPPRLTAKMKCRLDEKNKVVTAKSKNEGNFWGTLGNSGAGKRRASCSNWTREMTEWEMLHMGWISKLVE